MARSVRHDMASRGAAGSASRGWSWLAGGLVVAAGLAGAAWWSSQPSAASQTIALQMKLLDDGADPDAHRAELRTIMRSIDEMQWAERREVQAALFKRLGEMREESLDAYFAATTPAERESLLDRDLSRIQLVREVIEATDQGGMRVRTKEDEKRAEERRQRDEARRQQAAQPQAKPAAPVDAQAARERNAAREQQRKQVEAYTEALRKRAEDRGIDIGRFGGRSRRG